MIKRNLGGTGMEIGEVGYGAWGVGGNQWQGASDDEAVASLRRAIELGLNFIDTALAYGEGHSEKLCGQVVRESPVKVYLATKVPPMNRVWPAQKGTGIEEVFPYNYIVESTHTSLKNLGLERIDLLQLHVWNPEWLHREEWRRAAEDLKKSGKIRAFGLSLGEHDPDSGLEAIETGLIEAVQAIYNIFDQSPEKNLFPLCAERNIGVIARVPFDEGALTGTLAEDTQFVPGEFREWYFRDGRKAEAVAHAEAIMRDVPGDLAGTALQFCLSNPVVTTVIPGMRRVRHVESNIAVSARGPLPAATLSTLKRHAWNKNYYQ
jgi:aryl-alcohol dehydrogenase-like predicted oxidoreductase